MTPSDIITEVRRLVQDTRLPYRYEDMVLLGFVNQTLKRMAMLRPDLFGVITDIPTVPDEVLQSCPTDSIRLIEIFQVKNGNSITEVDREILNRTSPSWQNEQSGQPVNYMRHARNHNRFFVYPRPVAGVIIIGEYAQTPLDYSLNQTITLPTDAYFPVIVDGTVFLVESVDNEHVNSGRAKLFQDYFVQALGVSLQSRTLTDSEKGARNTGQVT
jgi:hypothetical protein